MEASLKKQKTSRGIDLEEIILSVYNEVKNSLERIECRSSAISESVSQFESSFLLNIESLRIRIPLLLPEECPEIPTFCDNTPINIQAKLLSPKHSAKQNGIAELEMTFSPVKRSKCT